jgi:putative sigma-54 modulation protein
MEGAPPPSDPNEFLFWGMKGAKFMKFVFTDKKVDVPGAIHFYAEKKVGKLDRFFKEDATAAITFSVEKERLNKVEITIRANGTIFRVSESTSDMHASIDAAVTTLERQIRKNKTRLEKRLRQGAFERAVEVEEVSSFAPDEPEEGEYNVVRTKTFPIKPMTKDEAILQMNLLGHSFFAFKDEEAGDAFAVVYRRNDGDYGLIVDGE